MLKVWTENTRAPLTLSGPEKDYKKLDHSSWEWRLLDTTESERAAWYGPFSKVRARVICYYSHGLHLSVRPLSTDWGCVRVLSGGVLSQTGISASPSAWVTPAIYTLSRLSLWDLSAQFYTTNFRGGILLNINAMQSNKSYLKDVIKTWQCDIYLLFLRSINESQDISGTANGLTPWILSVNLYVENSVLH